MPVRLVFFVDVKFLDTNNGSDFLYKHFTIIIFAGGRNVKHAISFCGAVGNSLVPNQDCTMDVLSHLSFEFFFPRKYSRMPFSFGFECGGLRMVTQCGRISSIFFFYISRTRLSAWRNIWDRTLTNRLGYYVYVRT